MDGNDLREQREEPGFDHEELAREPQICEACQKPFVCGFSLKGCWCSQVKLSSATREQLREKYHRCLCRSCLEKAEAGN